MFLATTSLSQFWNKDEEILFLGSWCLRFDRRQEWEGLRYQVMPSPWNDRKRFWDAARYVDGCTERMLGHLTEYLNAVHHVSFSSRYWRILVGCWLFHYLHVVYDRYVHLTEAFRAAPRLRTVVLDPSSFHVPRDLSQTIDLMVDDPYNLQIFSQVLQGLGFHFPARELAGWIEESQGTSPKRNWLGPVKVLAQSSLGVLENRIRWALARRWRIALCDLNLPWRTVWTMAWRTGFRALPLRTQGDWQTALPEPIFDQRRNGLAALRTTDPFEHVFVQGLPQNLPALYLEGYSSAREEVLAKHPRIPRVITSAVGWYTNEPFKFLAAEAAGKGSRLVAMQHGGGYGVYHLSAQEMHEVRLCDSYFTWGWGQENGSRLRNVPAPLLSELTNRVRRPRRDRLGSLVFIATINPRYFYRFNPQPQGTQMEDYFNWEFRFLRALPEAIRDQLLMRLYPEDFGHQARQRLLERFPKLRWDTLSSSHRSLHRSRLVVIDHVGTPLLEAMRANVPTVLYWNPFAWEVREEAQPYFEQLRAVGILWDSPEAAATHVENVMAQPLEWWASGRVQDVREKFVERYALGRENWWEQWGQALEREAALSRT